ncbi:MAG: peptidoglycan D,D-transpeptidase FtsI family protein [Acidimicrobiales bacterium]
MVILATACLVILGLRSLQVQGIDGAKYASYGQAEQFQSVALPAMRGTLYDRTGDVLAISVPRVDIVADDLQVRDPASTAPALARALGLPEATILSKLSGRSQYVPLAIEVGTAEQKKVEALNLPYLAYVPDTQREDPVGHLFDPLLGLVGWDGRGLSGIEYQYNKVLSGKAGKEDVAVGAMGDQLPGGAKNVTPANQGEGLVLSLDQPLQYEVTKALTAQVLAQKAASGSVIVLDTKTGGILSMVNLVRSGASVRPAQQNLALTAVYQPGSVMKLATIAGGLQDHLISPSSNFTVPYQITLGGWPFQDAEPHGTEQLDVSQILAQSSNVGTIEIAHLLGEERLYHYLRDLGFGTASGLGWPGESAGLLGSPATWSGSSMGSVPIGTGEAVTAMQIVDAYNAVANGGVFVPPHTVEGLVGASGKEHLVQPAARHRVLDQSTVEELVPMLEDVTSGGTGTAAQIPGYQIAGKTGTAQIPSATGPGYEPGAWMATFVGFVPAGNPQITAIVVLDHPASMYGGSAAAPVFSTIMKYALRHFDISPSGASSLPGTSNSSTRP